MKRYVIGTIYANEIGEGAVVLKPDFAADDPLFKADVLQCIVSDITNHYDSAIYDMRREAYAKRKENSK